MAFKKHNKFVLLPAGVSRQKAKQLLSTSVLTDRARFAMFWILDQADGFVVTVGGIRDAADWSEERWASIRDELRRAGMLRQERETLLDKSSRWTLTIDCESLFQDPPIKRARDTRATGGIRHAHVVPGESVDREIPPTCRGSEPKLEPKVLLIPNTARPPLQEGQGTAVALAMPSRPRVQPQALPARSGRAVLNEYEIASLGVAAARAFFDFFFWYGVGRWIVEGMARRTTPGPKHGTRGGLLGVRHGFAKPVEAAYAPEAFVKFGRRLLSNGKRLVDLHTREALDGCAAEDSGRVLLIDDLTVCNAKAVVDWWAGPVALLETSSENFQALLISPRRLHRPELTRAMRALQLKFDGDPRSAFAAHLHRFPSSPNYKLEGMDTGEPFLCRLVSLNDPVPNGDNGMAQLTELLASSDQIDSSVSTLLAAPALASSPVRMRAPTQLRQIIGVGAGRDTSPSAPPFSWAMSQLRKGASDTSILAGLEQMRGHHDARDWPVRSLHNAKFELGLVQSRYTCAKK